MAAQTRKCPLCAEEIPTEAAVCPYCSTQLVSESSPSAAPRQVRAAAPAPRKKNAWIWALAAGGLAFCICIAIGATLWFARDNLPAISGLLATPTHTRTRSPTPTRTPKPTSTPIPLIPWNEPHSLWLPDPEDIPGELELIFEDLETTNAEVASQYPAATATAITSRQMETGRVAGQYRAYQNPDRCSAQSGLFDMSVQAILHITASGAGEYLGLDYTYEPMDGIGDQAGVKWSYQDSDCSPSFPVRVVSAHFLRYNIRAYVDIAFIEGNVSDDDMLALAVRLAKIMDEKIVADAR